MQFTNKWAVASLVLIASSAKAEIGKIHPREWGASFDEGDIARSVFCIKKETSARNDRSCATAFLIDANRGWVLTAYHVAPPPSTLAEADKLDASGIPQSEQVLFDSRSRRYRFEIVKFKNQALSTIDAVDHPQPLIQAERNGLSYDFLRFVNPRAFDKFDAVLLRISAEDLGKVKTNGLKPLRFRNSPLLPGDRIFSAGYSWMHYRPQYFENLKKVLQPARTDHFENTDGNLSFLTGVYAEARSITLLSRATPSQISGTDPDTRALDTYPGMSGAPVLDSRGEVVGLVWASDSGIGPAALKGERKSTSSFILDAQAIVDAFGLSH